MDPRSTKREKRKPIRKEMKKITRKPHAFVVTILLKNAEILSFFR
jgi:hypothetical protein